LWGRLAACGGLVGRHELSRFTNASYCALCRNSTSSAAEDQNNQVTAF